MARYAAAGLPAAQLSVWRTPPHAELAPVVASLQAKAFAKAVSAGTKKVVDDVSTEVKLSRQYEGARPPRPLNCCCAALRRSAALVSANRCCCRVAVPRMEWEGVWASQYPSNDGKDGRVDLIRLDKDRTGKIVATKLTGTQSTLCGRRTPAEI
jgi:hypothetical protein